MQSKYAASWVSDAPVLADRISRAVAGTLLARPWFDRAGLVGLQHWFFPASRLWAAARAADGDLSRFFDEIPMPVRLEDRDRVKRALRRFDQARAAANAIEAEWQRVFFETQNVPATYLIAVEAARLDLRHAYNATRRHFRFLVGRDVPRVKLAIETPREVDAIYGSAAVDPVALFAPADIQPKIEVSHRVASTTGPDSWLRFPSPSTRLGDTVWARVHEPDGVVNPPTVIYGHGICVEFDHWRGLIDECRALVRLGFRVVRPEAPWHGRRVNPGSFGGERIIGAFPTGILDTLTAAVQEWAVIARWARETSTGPLVFAGSSLGALTSQLAASHASVWPRDVRPDAMLLITHTGDLAGAVAGGALSNLWANPDLLARAGWTVDLARKHLAILDPGPALAMPPGSVVSVLGRRDVILPFEGGLETTRRWGLPAENCFVWDRGHFSVPMTLVRDDAPLRRLAQIVHGLL